MGRGANEAMIVALNQILDGIQYGCIEAVKEAIFNPPHSSEETNDIIHLWRRLRPFAASGRKLVLHPHSEKMRQRQNEGRLEPGKGGVQSKIRPQIIESSSNGIKTKNSIHLEMARF
jgi:hypothetical protein